jgi:SAM-dependent methyltransferase
VDAAHIKVANTGIHPTHTVDLGCGSRKAPGAIGLDSAPISGVDVVADMRAGLPFRDSSLDGVYAYHVLEHFDDFIGMMEEIWRVLRPGGLARIKVPHATSSFVTWKDPTHRRGLSIATFAYFDDTYFDGAAFSYYSKARFRIERARLNFTMTDRAGMPDLAPPSPAGDTPPPPEPHIITVLRRGLNPMFHALANRSRGWQYACERFWGPIVGIEEASLVMRAIK